MECGDYDGPCASMARGPSGVGLQLQFGGERGVPVALGARQLPRQPAGAAALVAPPAASACPALPTDDGPFMNEMDEISYWIYTKRAPCLMNYDKLIKKQSDEAQCSKTVPEEVPSPRKKKKKRKLSMLDEESVSTEKQKNVYFEVSQKKTPMINTRKSESLGSNVDFNLTNTTVKEKAKRAKLQKNRQSRILKKPKLVTSTPKAPTNLRRSVRQARQTRNNAHLNSSLEIFNASVLSNGHIRNSLKLSQKPAIKLNKATQMSTAGDGDQTSDNKKNTPVKNRSKTNAHANGQFEDMSDVSGFTANYIRSTKVQSGKTPKKQRCKSGRSLVKQSQQSCREQDRPEEMVVCINKSMNTGMPNPAVLNCSTDSSQNIVNLVTTRRHDKSGKIDKSTSLLKFVDTRPKIMEETVNKVESKGKSKSNLNISFQSQSSSASRYPKRYKNHTETNIEHEVSTPTKVASKNCLEFNNCDKKEYPEEAAVARTRSGRNISILNRPQDNSVLVVSNSTEQVSSLVSMNVASPMPGERKKRRSTRPMRSQKLNNKSGQSMRRDSMREKSGFTACFSESDDDSVPLMQRKYFCN